MPVFMRGSTSAYLLLQQRLGLLEIGRVKTCVQRCRLAALWRPAGTGEHAKRRIVTEEQWWTGPHATLLAIVASRSGQRTTHASTWVDNGARLLYTQYVVTRAGMPTQRRVCAAT